MSWVRLDDHIDEHPKIAALSANAFRLFIFGLAYCNRTLTDGFLPRAIVMGKYRSSTGRELQAVRQLEAVGLWVTSENGWRIHDYHDFQPKRSKVLRERRVTAKRVNAYRTRNAVTQRVHKKSNAVGTPPPVPDPVPVPQEVQKELKAVADDDGTSPERADPKTDIARAVDAYRGLGVKWTHSDGGTIAAMVTRHGIETVLAVITDAGTGITKAFNPLSYFCGALRKRGNLRRVNVMTNALVQSVSICNSNQVRSNQVRVETSARIPYVGLGRLHARRGTIRHRTSELTSSRQHTATARPQTALAATLVR